MKLDFLFYHVYCPASGIWDMLLGSICQKPGQQDSLSQFKFFSCLDNSCDDQKIKTIYFDEMLRRKVYGAVSNLASYFWGINIGLIYCLQLYF